MFSLRQIALLIVVLVSIEVVLYTQRGDVCREDIPSSVEMKQMVHRSEALLQSLFSIISNNTDQKEILNALIQLEEALEQNIISGKSYIIPVGELARITNSTMLETKTTTIAKTNNSESIDISGKDSIPMEKTVIELAIGKKKPLLGIVVPYRNREDQLQVFSLYLKSFLELQDIPHLLYIIDQVDSNRFNRGMLLNVGAFLMPSEVEYFCFHDVDNLPLEGVRYDKPSGFQQLSSQISRNNWHPGYPKSVGGVGLFTREAFQKINGYSNRYWGWGGEDDDSYMRMVREGLIKKDGDPPERPPTGKGRFLDIVDGHSERDKSNRDNSLKVLREMERNQNIYKSDGLSSINFTLVDIENNVGKGYKRFKVSLTYMP